MIFKALLIYLFSLLLTNFSIFVIGQRIQVSEAFFLFLFLLWLKDLVKNRKLPKDTGLNKPFLLFIFFCLLSFLNSFNLSLSFTELLGLLYLFVMLILVVDVVGNKKKLDIIIRFWIGGLVVVLACGFIGLIISIFSGQKNIFCWVYSGNYPYFKNVYRTTSIFHHPLALANYLVVSLGLLASEFLLAENKRYKIFLKMVIFLTTLMILTTVSREITSFLLCVFLIYNYFAKKRNLKFRIVSFLLIALITVTFLFTILFCSTFHIRSYKIESLSKHINKELIIDINYAYPTRLAYKMAALEMLKRHPFLGVGLKMYRPSLQKLNSEHYFYDNNLVPVYEYSVAYHFSDSPRVNDPHNDVLQYFAETGIFGGCAFIFLVATFLYLILSNLKKAEGYGRYFKVRLFCFMASFVGVLIESIDLDVFKIRFVWFLMALMLALIMMHKDKVDKVI